MDSAPLNRELLSALAAGRGDPRIVLRRVRAYLLKVCAAGLARPAGKPSVLGCPGGRTTSSTGRWGQKDLGKGRRHRAAEAEVLGERDGGVACGPQSWETGLGPHRDRAWGQHVEVPAWCGICNSPAALGKGGAGMCRLREHPPAPPALQPALPVRLREGNPCPRRSFTPSLPDLTQIFHFFQGVSFIFLAFCPDKNRFVFKQ